MSELAFFHNTVLFKFADKIVLFQISREVYLADLPGGASARDSVSFFTFSH